MSKLTSKDRLRVLLSNDDGPPGKDSPYIYGFARHLSELGWDVKVVVPSSQKSWIGKAYQIKEITRGRYFYPRHPDGTGEITTVSRPVKRDEGEYAEWILLDGTPATCVNIALHNLYKDQIDLVISGPNYGRNSSAAFILSSGTIGAALSSSLSRIRSIAVSYGTVSKITPDTLHDAAHTLSTRIINRLVDDWGTDESGVRNGEIDLYNVNIPMIHALLDKESLPVVWTTVWRNSYGQLFKPHALGPAAQKMTMTEPAGGPDAVTGHSADTKGTAAGMPKREHELDTHQSDSAAELVFKFAPSMDGLIGPGIAAPEGSDAWAVENGMASVTPLRACFAEPLLSSTGHAIGENGPRSFKL